MIYAFCTQLTITMLQGMLGDLSSTLKHLRWQNDLPSVAQKKLTSAELIFVSLDLESFDNIYQAIAWLDKLQAITSAPVAAVGFDYQPSPLLQRELHAPAIGRYLISSEANLRAFLHMHCAKYISGDISAADVDQHALPEATTEDVPRPTEQVQNPTQQFDDDESTDAKVKPEPEAVQPASESADEPPSIEAAAPQSISIGLVGAGHRIGTTTQAVQLLHFALHTGHTAAMAQAATCSTMQEYLHIADDIELIDSNHYRIGNLPFVRSLEVLQAEKSRYNVSVFDFGALDELPDAAAFMACDVKIIVGGVKPWEMPLLYPAFELDDNSFHFVFSFVPTADRPDVIAQMLDSGRRTHFALWAPDYLTWCGDDALYTTLLGCLTADTNVSKHTSTTTPKKRNLASLFAPVFCRKK